MRTVSPIMRLLKFLENLIVRLVDSTSLCDTPDEMNRHGSLSVTGQSRSENGQVHFILF